MIGYTGSKHCACVLGKVQSGTGSAGAGWRRKEPVEFWWNFGGVVVVVRLGNQFYLVGKVKDGCRAEQQAQKAGK